MDCPKSLRREYFYRYFGKRLCFGGYLQSTTLNVGASEYFLVQYRTPSVSLPLPWSDRKVRHKIKAPSILTSFTSRPTPVSPSLGIHFPGQYFGQSFRRQGTGSRRSSTSPYIRLEHLESVLLIPVITWTGVRRRLRPLICCMTKDEKG